MSKEVKKLDRQQVFKGRILDVVIDSITFPNGQEAKREMVIHHGAAAIVPFDNEGNIYLVEQYRHPVGDYILEIPAGTLEPGEDPKVCAERELEEEIGYKAGNIQHLMDIYPAVGFSTERIAIYTAHDLIESEQNLDEDEFVEVKKFSLDEIVEMIDNGQILDSKSICALLKIVKDMKLEQDTL
ncbi:NUDIX domain-containing protein [Vallitalea okinawensis]|uniref:NUDIX domain-containing protein n=1 Tax=Vallitalea okinawensis TaxID=2078660 RepID=UPI000CFAD184|nr:NUDIX hydrolase [Vallitalea okinawensis]